MHCVRRAALRSAIAASRQLSQKATPASFAVQATTKPALPKQIQAVPARFFSLTARARNVEEPPTAETATAESTNAETEEANPLKQGLNQPSRAGRRGYVDPTPYAIFVHNITFEADDGHLTSAFSKYGEVVEARIARDSAGLPKGFGFVFFKDEESVHNAVENCDGTFWHGRQIHVKPRLKREPPPRKPRTSGPTETLYIGGIPQDATDSDLNHFFRGLKNVKEVRVAVDRTTGWPRGFAHVDFTDVDSAVAAKSQLDGSQLGGRPLTLDYAESGPRKTISKKD
ncbi:hypothetical protein QBC47DRAFT_376847 [Echria macrotheca]|uniref:RRM domain-containing protein n=1 Tax=Echria macrotheca TaxID=438768 RepID=A0AAJ0BGU5_9PEZI|nr:hypothetical protein QBC47DRAFT_376847 [Echria macrotheca]